MSQSTKLLPQNQQVARFFSKIQVKSPDECWEWQGRLDKGNYGKVTFFFFGKNHWRAHRVVWMMANGQPIPNDLHVRHKCDNPKCCNPEHLELGTTQQNTQDRQDRGRTARGDRSGRRSKPENYKSLIGATNPAAKVSDDFVQEIVNLYNTGQYTQAKLSRMFSVPAATLSKWVRGVTRKSTPVPVSDSIQSLNLLQVKDLANRQVQLH